MPPGLFPDVDYEGTTIALEPGDSVLFCTDGITDAFDLENEPFGVERLQGVCQAKFHAKPPELLTCLFSAVEKFTRGRKQHDDMAAAVFHFSCSD